MTIKIKDTDYNFKQTIRALFLWEQIAQRQFEIKTTLDNYLYFYCLLLANNPDFISWDDYLDSLDDDPAILVRLAQMINNQSDIDKLLNPDDDESADGKKKD